MLNINTEYFENTELTVALAGRLDTTTAPQLDETLAGLLDGVTYLIFDLQDLEYISSAGLRVLLRAQKIMNVQGSMVIRNASEDVYEIFDVTGFTSIFQIEAEENTEAYYKGLQSYGGRYGIFYYFC